MNIGIIGLPNSGKTTIFNGLTKSEARISAYANTKSEPNRGVLEVGDDRIMHLSEMYLPKKTTYAVIELIDFPGLTQGAAREGLFSSASMGLIKNMDAIALVVRHFDDDLAGSPTPLEDITGIDEELLLSDLILVENRLERIENACRRGKKTDLLESEKRILLRISAHSGSNRPIRELELDAEAQKTIRGFQFLTQKPILVILNSDETRFGKNQHLLDGIRNRHQVIEFAGKFEMELSQLTDQEEIELFMADMGIGESARDRLCRAAYEMLGYISFFTVGADEVRAWSIRNAETALGAAGTIHSDLARGFIRVECVSYDDLMMLDSEKRVGEKGLRRLEDRDYIVRDGNILNIRFNI